MIDGNDSVCECRFAKRSMRWPNSETIRKVLTFLKGDKKEKKKKSRKEGGEEEEEGDEEENENEKGRRLANQFSLSKGIFSLCQIRIVAWEKCNERPATIL